MGHILAHVNMLTWQNLTLYQTCQIVDRMHTVLHCIHVGVRFRKMFTMLTIVHAFQEFMHMPGAHVWICKLHENYLELSKYVCLIQEDQFLLIETTPSMYI